MSTVKKSYNQEAIESAITDIEEKNTSIRKAAFKYGIPFSTLTGRRGNNNAIFKELMTVHTFKFLCKWGYDLTRNDVMHFASDYFLRTNQSDLFKNGRPDKGWF